MKWAPVAIVVAGLTVCIPPLAVADEAPARHTCQPPVIPPQPMDRNVAATLQSGIDGYKSCVQAYVDGQLAAAGRHRNAANSAIEEFNEFISTKIPKEPKEPAK